MQTFLEEFLGEMRILKKVQTFLKKCRLFCNETIFEN